MRRRWKWLLAAGLLIAAGMHMRGVGVALALAAVVSLPCGAGSRMPPSCAA